MAQPEALAVLLDTRLSSFGSIATTGGTMLIVARLGTGPPCRGATYLEVCGLPTNHSIMLIACPQYRGHILVTNPKRAVRAIQPLALSELGRGVYIEVIKPFDPFGLIVDTSCGEDHPIGLVRRMAFYCLWSG
jgi:hypothetical protein